MPLWRVWDLGLSLRYSRRRLQPQELAFGVGGLQTAIEIGFRFD